ncbi:MAG TPA: vitamin B12 dependent-methionine synthase activation domain-containing protein [Anaerolineae bacterium]|nr:vitamin B12 dependent-methionine synthase activation domain-containing protein [Anaerolineae bacterium]
MDVEILERIRLESDLEDLRARLRIKEGTARAERFAQLVREAQDIARPRAMFGVAYVDSKDDSSVVLDGIRFDSRVLRVNLDGTHRAFPFVITCGTELHKWAAANEDLVLHFYADQICEAALGVAQAALQRRLDEQYRPGSLSSMSPGSLPDWPLTAQRPLFALLGDPEQAIGVRLTESLLMVPAKSVSGIWFATEQSFASCQLCPRSRCHTRRAPYDGTLFESKYGTTHEGP